MVSEKGKWALSQIILSDILQNLGKEFFKIGIDYMPIKGAYLISANLAEKLEYRKISDLDILVKTGDLKMASQHFSDLPQCRLITWFEDNYRPTETVLKYKYNDFEYTIEIMDRINSDARFLLTSETLFERSISKGKNLFFPSPEDSLIIHICHLQSHIPFEFRNTHTKEAKLLIEQKNFNWNQFWQSSNDTGMNSFIIFFLKYYNKDLKQDVILQKGFLYSKILAKWFTIKRYEKMHSILKRVLLDIPFTRKPFILIFQKFSNRNYEKKRNQPLLS